MIHIILTALGPIVVGLGVAYYDGLSCTKRPTRARKYVENDTKAYFSAFGDLTHFGSNISNNCPKLLRTL